MSFSFFIRKLFLYLLVLISNNSYANTDEISPFIQLGHTQVITTIAFSSNGRYVASGSADSNIIIWDAKSGKEIKVLKGHTEGIRSLTFSKDNQRLLSSSMDKTLRLWNIKTGKTITTYKGHKSAVMDADISPEENEIVSLGLNSSVIIWDLQTGKETQRRQLGVVPNIDQDETFFYAYKSEYFVDYSVDGQYILIGDNTNKLTVIDRNNTNIFSIKENSPIKNAAFLPLNNLILFSSNNSLKLWDMNAETDDDLNNEQTEGELIWEIADKHFNFVFSSDGKSIYVRDHSPLPGNDKNYTLNTIDTLSGHITDTSTLNNIYLSALSKDGNKLISSDGSNIITLWNLHTKKTVMQMRGHSTSLSNIALSSDNTKLAIQTYKDIKIWDIESLKLTNNINVKSNGRILDFSPDGRHIVSTSNNEISFFDIDTDTKAKSFIGHQRNIEHIALSPDGDYLISAGNNRDDYSSEIIIWNMKTGKRIKQINDSSMIDDIFISPDSRYFFYNQLSKVKIINLKTGKLIKEIETISSVRKIRLTKDNKHLLTSNYDYTLKLFDIKSEQLIRTYKGHNTLIDNLSISKKGDLIVSSSLDSTTIVWNLKTGAKLNTFTGENTHFINNGKSLVGIYKNSLVKIWDVYKAKDELSLIAFDNDSHNDVHGTNQWLVMTPDHYFMGSEKAAKYMSIRKGMNVYSIDQFYDQLYRPDIVRSRFNLNNNSEFKALAKTTPGLSLEQILNVQAPELSFISPENSTELSSRDIEFKISIKELGGGIGKLIWKINGISVGVENISRGLKRKKNNSTSTQSVLTKQDEIIHTKTLTLSPGKNLIEVIAYNENNTMTSVPVSLNLTLKDSISTPPSLYVLGVGINRYRDKSLWLNYAVPDVKGLTKQLEKSAKKIFNHVQVTQVLDKDASLNGLKQAFNKIAKQAKTNDVFVLYLAGHGLTLDSRYHFLPVDFRYRNDDSVRKHAINQDHLQKWMAGIKARKSLILLDTCNSGSYVQAQAVSRGLTEKTAIDKLIRATGRTTIAASSDTQVALEGIENHGVFTYALMKGLKYADKLNGNRDGTVTTSELANYIDEVVPDLTYKKWGYEQIPQVNLQGRPFPVGLSIK